MNPVQISSGKAQILYDADRGVQIDSRFFDPGYWQERGALQGTAMGRGTTFFVRHGEEGWVVRHYRRGGLIARLLKDSYLWRGLQATRAWREWHLLAELHAEGLPVPLPVAAQVRRAGLWYRADIITVRIDATPLSGLLREGRLPAQSWAALGVTLRRLHDHGVWHADLNAHNILIDARGSPFVIDFDRGERRAAHDKICRWKEGNLERLHRSLSKLSRIYPEYYFHQDDWGHLMNAYRNAQ